jgi:DNA-binding NtrC family response regulator
VQRPTKQEYGAHELLGSSPEITAVRTLVERAARSRGGVLCVAEIGIELEPVVHSIHRGSDRPESPYIAVDCGHGAPDHLERELFGATEATKAADLERISNASLLASARGGTLFLRDVAELPAGVQSRLARLIRDGEARIDGEAVPIDVRVVGSAAATIDRDVRTNRLRPDLYRRLAACRIDWPPLRTRRGDIPELITALVSDFREATGIDASLSEAAVSLLSALPWPGNLAELRSVLRAAIARPHPAPIEIRDLLDALKMDIGTALFVPGGTLREARFRFEREYISSVLRHHNWSMAEAAQTLGIQRPNLYRKARQLSIAFTGTSES